MSSVKHHENFHRGTPVALPELPYSVDALEPFISARTLEFHYGKHHRAYSEKTAGFIKGTDLEKQDLETVLLRAAGDPEKRGLFNNAAQDWNHGFYWKSMTPNGGGIPGGKIGSLIERDFGSFDKFRDIFLKEGAGRFGSGWVWLVEEGERLKVLSTENAENPMVDGLNPILVADVWEHAYYLDYQNKRPDYLVAFIDHLVNWDFAAANL